MMLDPFGLALTLNKKERVAQMCILSNVFVGAVTSFC